MKSKLSIVLQVTFIAALLGITFAVMLTARENLLRQNIATGWDFLTARTGWDVGTALLPHTTDDPYWWTFVVGLLNTVVLSAVSIGLATAAGLLLALAASSSGRILAAFTGTYVWIFRNIPIIVQVFFWYHVTRQFPPVRQASLLFGCCYVSNRGIYIPRAELHADLAGVAAILLSCALAYWGLRRYNRSRIELRRPALPRLVSIGIWLCAVGIVAVSAARMDVTEPQLQGFNFIGGAYLSPEFAALVIAIVAYNTAFVAEIIKAGIRSIPGGQVEAARVIGLSGPRIFWTIVIPQALRVAVPALVNQYISITKSSSLAIVIGYTDLFSIGAIAINHTGQSIEIILLLMLIYLAIGSTLSALGNYYNRAFAMRGTQ
jgi:general L-amino acid transport system permease protein